ncbi:hypothetical protein X797_011213 [Metarhizium robertsii]|uniref:CFEM domain-containing protein n=3 Tax=Metarhizium TaxID=5529 RepID=A0A0B2XFT6_METRA
MKSQLLLAASVTLATAFDFSGQPECAVHCLKDAIAMVNCTLDLQCVCPKSTQGTIRDEAMGCVFASCQASDVVKAQKAAAAACATFTPAVDGPNSHSATRADVVLPTTISGAAARVPRSAFVSAFFGVAVFREICV